MPSRRERGLDVPAAPPTPADLAGVEAPEDDDVREGDEDADARGVHLVDDGLHPRLHDDAAVRTHPRTPHTIINSEVSTYTTGRALLLFPAIPTPKI